MFYFTQCLNRKPLSVSVRERLKHTAEATEPPAAVQRAAQRLSNDAAWHFERETHLLVPSSQLECSQLMPGSSQQPV